MHLNHYSRGLLYCGESVVLDPNIPKMLANLYVSQMSVTEIIFQQTLGISK